MPVKMNYNGIQTNCNKFTFLKNKKDERCSLCGGRRAQSTASAAKCFAPSRAPLVLRWPKASTKSSKCCRRFSGKRCADKVCFARRFALVRSLASPRSFPGMGKSEANAERDVKRIRRYRKGQCDINESFLCANNEITFDRMRNPFCAAQPFVSGANTKCTHAQCTPGRCLNSRAAQKFRAHSASAI